MGNGLLARLLRGRVPQVGRSDGWPPRLPREPDRIPPTGRLTVTRLWPGKRTSLLSNGPGLLRALNMIRSGEATALVVPNLDRLGRNLTTQEAALALAWDAGARIYSVDEGEITEDDPDDPMRTAIRQMPGVMHQLDRALISKRLRAGRQAKADSGGYVGGTVPYGFRLVNGQVVADDDEQKVVALVGRRALAGAYLRQIGDELDRKGYRPRSGGTWHPNTVRRIAAYTVSTE